MPVLSCVPRYQEVRLLNAPTITPAQIIAVLGAVLGLLVSLTVIDDELSKAIAAAAAVIVPVVFTLADAIIRQGRAKAIGLGAQVQDGKLIPPTPYGPQGTVALTGTGGAA